MTTGCALGNPDTKYFGSTSKELGGNNLGKKLIITEKPSVAQDYAKVFQVSGRQNGYIENDKYVITWCV